MILTSPIFDADANRLNSIIKFPDQMNLDDRLFGSIDRVLDINPCLIVDEVIDETQVHVDTRDCSVINVDPDDEILMAVNILQGGEFIR